MYFARGDYTQAEVFLRLALPDFEKALGSVHPEVAKTLNNLALLELRRRNHTQAESYLRRALAIHQKSNPEHHDAVPPLINLALLYYDKEDYERAEPLYRRALAILEKALGPEHPEVAGALSRLALLYHAKKDYAQAESVLGRVLAIREKKLTADHPDVAAAINDLGRLYYAKDQYERAVQFLTRGNAVEERSLALILTTGSERQKQLYLNTISNSLHAAVSLHARALPQNEQAAQLAVTAILQRKGRALDALTDQLLALRRHASPQDQEILDQLAALRNRAATLQLSSEVQSSPEMQRIVAAVARFHIEAKENEIGRRSAEFRAQTLPITLQAIRQTIPAGAALVEILAYEPFDAKAKNDTEKRGAAYYVAYVLRRDEAVPQFVELGEVASIDAEVERLRTALKDPRRTDVQTIARALDKRVMQPIRNLLGPTQHLFLSPDGALNLIPFAALVDENGKYLLAQLLEQRSRPAALAGADTEP
jgi:tetratricopeptide (TPR) repeat protein